MPSPGSRSSPYSNPPDSPFHPPSPGVAMYQQQNQALPQQPAQAPQQRLQRAVSIPSMSFFFFFPLIFFYFALIFTNCVVDLIHHTCFLLKL